MRVTTTTDHLQQYTLYQNLHRTKAEKGIMYLKCPVVGKQVKPMKRLEQIRLDKELAFKLQAGEEEEEEERLAREKAQQIEEAKHSLG
ncbi:hypothetical protein Tco_0793297 [Tanacetum coccineum]